MLTLTTQNDDVSVNEDILDGYSAKPSKAPRRNKKKCRFIDFRRDYTLKLIIIFIMSLIFGSIMGIIVIYSSYFEAFGFYVVLSKFSSTSIIF